MESTKALLSENIFSDFRSLTEETLDHPDLRATGGDSTNDLIK